MFLHTSPSMCTVKRKSQEMTGGNTVPTRAFVYQCGAEAREPVLCKQVLWESMSEVPRMPPKKRKRGKWLDPSGTNSRPANPLKNQSLLRTETQSAHFQSTLLRAYERGASRCPWWLPVCNMRWALARWGDQWREPSFAARCSRSSAGFSRACLTPVRQLQVELHLMPVKIGLVGRELSELRDLNCP